MKTTQYWKNFKLGEELSIAGAFIYNGLRRFHELRKLDHTDEIFEVLYYLAIGLERLMKVALILLEHDETADQEDFEQSLITHSHQELLGRIKRKSDLTLSGPGNDFLGLLTNFYITFRYDRFSLQSVGSFERERNAVLDFLEKHLPVQFGDRRSVFGIENSDQYRTFLRRTVIKISSKLYEITSEAARDLNLYTYEVRSGSKAETVFLGETDHQRGNIEDEEILWKELLIFFMNTKSTSGYLTFLRETQPLKFDPALIEDYLACFRSDSAKSEVMDELEVLYEDVPDKSDRIQRINAIGESLYFDEDRDDIDQDNDPEDPSPTEDT